MRILQAYKTYIQEEVLMLSLDSGGDGRPPEYWVRWGERRGGEDEVVSCGSIDTIADVRVEGEVGVQSDAQDFMGVSGNEVRGMCRAVKEIGHRVVGGAAGGVIDPDYKVAVALEPRATVGPELAEGASVRPGQQLFCWVNCRLVAMSTLLSAWDRTISSIIRPRRRRLTKGWGPSSSTPPKMRGRALG